MVKTIPSNNIIVFPLIFLSTIVWGSITSEKVLGVVFYAFVLGIFFSLTMYIRESNMAFLRIEEGILKVRYLFKRKENRDIMLYKIEGHIELERHIGGQLVSTFPDASDYLNYSWYFTPEKFLLRMHVEGKMEEIYFNVNILRFKYFMLEFVKKLHSINDDKLKTITTNFDTTTLSISWLSLIGKYFVDFD